MDRLSKSFVLEKVLARIRPFFRRRGYSQAGNIRAWWAALNLVFARPEYLPILLVVMYGDKSDIPALVLPYLSSQRSTRSFVLSLSQRTETSATCRQE
jgi:hypothetical protein